MAKKTSRTVSLIKPDVSDDDRIVARIIMLYIRAGLEMRKIKKFKMDEKLFKAFYGEHKGKPFYDVLKSFSTSGWMYGFLWQLDGEGAVELVRRINGATDPAKARIGTIRHIFGDNMPGFMHRNAVHGSDSAKAAEKEELLIFCN